MVCLFLWYTFIKVLWKCVLLWQHVIINLLASLWSFLALWRPILSIKKRHKRLKAEEKMLADARGQSWDIFYKMSQSQMWVDRFSLPWQQAPASSQEGWRLARWGILLQTANLGPASLLETPELSFWVGWGRFHRGLGSRRVRACCKIRMASEE